MNTISAIVDLNINKKQYNNVEVNVCFDTKSFELNLTPNTIFSFGDVENIYLSDLHRRCDILLKNHPLFAENLFEGKQGPVIDILDFRNYRQHSLIFSEKKEFSRLSQMFNNHKTDIRISSYSNTQDIFLFSEEAKNDFDLFNQKFIDAQKDHPLDNNTSNTDNVKKNKKSNSNDYILNATQSSNTQPTSNKPTTNNSTNYYPTTTTTTTTTTSTPTTATNNLNSKGDKEKDKVGFMNYLFGNSKDMPDNLAKLIHDFVNETKLDTKSKGKYKTRLENIIKQYDPNTLQSVSSHHYLAALAKNTTYPLLAFYLLVILDVNLPDMQERYYHFHSIIPSITKDNNSLLIQDAGLIEIYGQFVELNLSRENNINNYDLFIDFGFYYLDFFTDVNPIVSRVFKKTLDAVQQHTSFDDLKNKYKRLKNKKLFLEIYISHHNLLQQRINDPLVFEQRFQIFEYLIGTYDLSATSYTQLITDIAYEVERLPTDIVTYRYRLAKAFIYQDRNARMNYGRVLFKMMVSDVEYFIRDYESADFKLKYQQSLNLVICDSIRLNFHTILNILEYNQLHTILHKGLTSVPPNIMLENSIAIFRGNNSNYSELQRLLLPHLNLCNLAIVLLNCPTVNIRFGEITTNFKNLKDLSKVEMDFRTANPHVVLSSQTHKRYYEFCTLFIDKFIKINSLNRFSEYVKDVPPNTLLFILFFTYYLVKVNKKLIPLEPIMGKLSKMIKYSNNANISWQTETDIYENNVKEFKAMISDRLQSITYHWKKDNSKEYNIIASILSEHFDQQGLPSEVDLTNKYNQELRELENLNRLGLFLVDRFGFRIPLLQVDNGDTRPSILINDLLALIINKTGTNPKDTLREDSSISFLKYFLSVEHKSFFEIIFKYYRSSSKNQTIDDIARNTSAFMKKLIDQDNTIPLNNIFQDIIDTRDINYKKELQYMYKYFYPTTKYEDKETLLQEFITRATSLYGIQLNINELFIFLSKNGNYISITDLQRDKDEIENTFSSISQLTIGQSQNTLEKSTKLIGGLNYHQLKYFGYIHPELIEFFASIQDIKTTNQIITHNLINDDFNTNIMNNTIHAYEMLSPFIQNHKLANKDNAPVVYKNITELCLIVAKLLPASPHELDLSLKKILSVLQQLSHIKGLYLSAGGSLNSESILPAVVQILKGSEFNSRNSKSDEGVVGWFVKTDASSLEFTQEKIEDFVQGLKIISNDQNHKHTATIEQFEDIVRLLTEIHQLHCELDRNYHTKYFKGILQQKFSGDTRKDLADLVGNLKLDLESWTNSIKELPNRLWLLRAHGLSSLISTYEKVISETKTDQIDANEMSSKIYPFIKYCYPLANLTLDSVKLVLQANPALLDKTQTYIQFVAKLIEIIDKLKTMEETKGKDRGPVLVHIDSKVNLYNVLMQLNNECLPHPSQVFYSYSFGKDYQYIFDLVEKVQGYNYFLIGVPSEKDKLINWLSDHYSNQNKDLARLYIISTESMATDLFSFLPTHNEAFDTNWKNFKQLWEQKREKVGIDSLELVKGESGTGKSFFIKSKCTADRNPITVYFRPNFDSKLLIEHLNKLNTPGGKKKVLIHFSISAYCDFDSFNHFFYPLITSGYVFGNRVGEIINVSDNLSLQIFIEIGSPKKNPKDVGVISYDEYLSNSIPLIVNLAKHSDHTKSDWIISPTELKCFSYTKFTDKPPLPSAGNGIAMSAYLTLITNLLKNEFGYDPEFLQNPRMLIQRNSFLKLLHERLTFLDDYYHQCKRYKEYHVKDLYLSPYELLPHLILEAAKLSDPKLSSVRDFWRNPPMITIRSCNSYTADGETEITHTVDYLDFSENPLLSKKVSSIHTAKSSEAEFRSKLGTAFDIKSRTGIVINLCHQYNYVLTADFGMRLLMLHNKVKNQRSLVLTGDTGVGKTFILLFYSLLINAKNDALPDITLNLVELINNIIIDNPNFTLQGFEKIHRDLNKKVHTEEAKVLPGDVSRQRIIDALKQLCDYEPTIPAEVVIAAPPAKPAAAAVAEKRGVKFRQTNKEIKEMIFADVQLFIQNMIQKYKLIDIQPNSLLDNINKGVTTIQGFSTLAEAITEISSITFKGLFHRIIMHQKFTSKEFKLVVESLITKAEQLKKEIDPNLKMVVFIDEFNTSPDDTLSLINEIFIDGTIDGAKTIPDNIFWVGAMNPLVKSENSADTTGLVTSHSNQAFVVNHPPPSMEQLFLNYGEFTSENERPFLDSLFSLRSDICQDNDPDDLKEFIIFGQEAMRAAKQGRIHVSIRDITRVIDLYQFFSQTDIGKGILACTHHTIRENPHLLHWYSICTAIALSYYIRSKPGADRIRILEPLNRYYNKNAPVEMRHNYRNFDSFFKEIYTNFCNKEHMEIPEGIALTESLKLNIFCITVSINCRIPICIVGPPGCSKTLSFSIVMNNMNGKKHQLNEKNESPWAHMPSADAFRYQSTPHTTDVEIKSVFEGSLKRQKIYDLSGGKSRCVVFIDEAGLVNENDSPMKVMHDYLDKVSQKMDKTSVDISVVILSNKVLDAAKTNRMLLLLHPTNITVEDERALVKGVLYNNQRLNEKQLKICHALCTAYNGVNQFAQETKPNLFHQRDFVYFLRHLARGIKKSNSDTLNSKILIESIERNFSGIPQKDFKNLAANFFTEFEKEKDLNISRGNLLDSDRTIQRIEESLSETLEPSQDPNSVPFRYIMVIDPTENESSLMILKELNVDATVIRVGGFERDSTTEALVNVVSQVKSKMTSGGTVVLVNTHQIDACFYDVFNRYFTLLPTPDGSMHFIANVSFGTHSIFCPVHPDFKIIVHLPLSQMSQTQLPWLNRFEKYQLSISNFMDYFINKNLPTHATFFDMIKQSAKHFVDEFHMNMTNKSLLSGFSESETIPSLIYSIAKDMIVTGRPKIVPQRLPNDQQLTKPDENEYRLFNWKLLQIARPESIFNCKTLPQSYIEEYLLRQEHFNILRFLDHIFKQKFVDKDESIPNKWTFFTRTSLTLHRLKDSEHMDKFHKIFLNLLTGDENQKILKIIQLGSFKSSFECESVLDRFIKSDHLKICMVIADMSHVNQHQINFIINKFSKHNTSKLLITICHYPPEFSLSNQTKLNSIFLNGMEYMYIDSLGLHIDSQLMENSNNYIDADIRTWIAKAFGLKGVHIDPLSLEASFEKMFFEQLIAVSQTMSPYNSYLLMPQDRPFYCNAENRQKMIITLFKKHPDWYNEIIRKFSKNWNQQKQFNQILSNISNLVLSGKYVHSFIDSIKNSMTSYVYPIVAQIFKLLTNYQAYQQIEKLPDWKDANGILITEVMIQYYIKSIKIPRLSDHVELRFEPVSLVAPSFRMKPMLPLYDSISNTIKMLFDITLNKNPNRGIDHITLKFAEVVKSHPIHHVIDYINQHDKLFIAYQHDFITRTMNLVDKKWVSFITLVIRTVFRNHIDSVLLLTVVVHFYSKTINYIKNLVSPLLNLEDSHQRILELMEENEQNIVHERQVKSTVSAIAMDILSKHIREIDPNDTDIVEKTSIWCSVVREILNRISIDTIIKLQSKNEFYSSVCYIFTMFNLSMDISIKKEDQLVPTLQKMYQIYGVLKLDASDCVDTIAKSFQMLNDTLKNDKLEQINISCFLDTIEPFIHFGVRNFAKFISIICNPDPKHNLPFLYDIPIGWLILFIGTRFNTNKKLYKDHTLTILKELNITNIANPILVCAQSTPNSPSDHILGFIGITREQYQNQIKNCKIVNIFYFVFLEIHKESPTTDLLNCYNKLVIEGETNILAKVERYAVMACLMDKLVTIFNSGAVVKSILDELNNHNVLRQTLLSELKVKKEDSLEIKTNKRWNQIYILFNIKSYQLLLEILKSKEILSAIGMEENCHIKDALSVKESTIFSFVIDETTNDGKTYKELNVAIEKCSNDLLNALLDRDQSPRQCGFLRMSLLLITYQCYIDNRQNVLTFISNIIKAGSKLSTDIKLTPYREYYEKIITGDFDPNTSFGHFLVRDPNKQPDVHSQAQLLVNLLAISIGSSNNTYMYHLTNEYHHVIGRHYPASDTGTLIDCGMKYFDKGQLALNTNSMQGNITNKFMITTTSWGTIAWTASIAKQKDLDYMTDARVHFANYVTKKTVADLTDYVLARSFTSFVEFTQTDHGDIKVEPSHLISEFIYALWDDGYSNPQPAMKAKYANSQEVVAYEDYLIKLINKVKGDYNQTLVKRLKVVLDKSEFMRQIKKIRDEISHTYISPMIEFKNITDLITTNNQLLTFFYNNLSMICISGQFNILVRFIQMFFRYFQRRLPKEYEYLTVPKCIEYLKENKLESYEDIASLKMTWNETKEAWTNILKFIKSLEGGCAERPDFEKHIQHIDDNIPLAQLLHKRELNSDGLIINLINNWMDNTQAKAINLRDEVEMTGMFRQIIEGEKDNSANEDIGNYSFEIGNDNFFLIGSSFEVKDFQHFIVKSVQQYQTFIRSQFKPNILSIERKLIYHYISGKIIGGKQLKQYAIDFPYLITEKPENVKQGLSDKSNLIPESIRELIEVNHKLDDSVFNVSCPLEVHFKSQCSKLHAEELEILCRFLLSMALRLYHTKIETINSQESVYSVCEQLLIKSYIPDTIKSIFQKSSICNIKYLNQVFINVYLSFGYLYSNTIREPAELDTEFVQFFDNMRFILLKEAKASLNIHPWIDYLQEIIEKLSSPNSRDALKTPNVGAPLKDHLVNFLTDFAHPIMSQTYSKFTSMVLGNMPLTYYPYFMRTIHDVLSSLKIIDKDNITAAGQYKELFNIAFDDIPIQKVQETDTIEDDDDTLSFDDDSTKEEVLSDDEDQYEQRQSLNGSGNIGESENFGDQAETYETETLNSMEEKYHRSIKPVPTCSYFTCIINWIRFKPELTKVIQVKDENILIERFKNDYKEVERVRDGVVPAHKQVADLYHKFSNDCKSISITDIEIDKLYQYINEIMDYGEQSHFNVCDCMLQTLQTLSRMESNYQTYNLLRGKMSNVCSNDKCAKQLDQGFYDHFIFNDSYPIESDMSIVDLFERNYNIKFWRNEAKCKNCNSCSKINLLEEPQYIFIHVERKLSGEKVKHKVLFDTQIELFHTEKEIRYSLHSVICHEDEPGTKGFYSIHIKNQNDYLRCTPKKISFIDQDTPNQEMMEKNGVLFIYTLSLSRKVDATLRGIHESPQRTRLSVGKKATTEQVPTPTKHVTPPLVPQSTPTLPVTVPVATVTTPPVVKPTTTTSPIKYSTHSSLNSEEPVLIDESNSIASSIAISDAIPSTPNTVRSPPINKSDSILSEKKSIFSANSTTGTSQATKTTIETQSVIANETTNETFLDWLNTLEIKQDTKDVIIKVATDKKINTFSIAICLDLYFYEELKKGGLKPISINSFKSKLEAVKTRKPNFVRTNSTFKNEDLEPFMNEIGIHSKDLDSINEIFSELVSIKDAYDLKVEGLVDSGIDQTIAMFIIKKIEENFEFQSIAQ